MPDEMIRRLSVWVLLSHVPCFFIIQFSTPHLSTRSQQIIPLPNCLQPSLFGMNHRARRNEVMFSHLSPHHAAAQKLQGEQIVYGNPGIRVRLTTPPLKRQKGSKYCMVTRVPGYPFPPYPPSLKRLKGSK